MRANWPQLLRVASGLQILFRLGREIGGEEGADIFPLPLRSKSPIAAVGTIRIGTVNLCERWHDCPVCRVLLNCGAVLRVINEGKGQMSISPLAGKPAPKDLLVDLARLELEYLQRRPDIANSEQMVSFGTSGHRGSP